MNNFKDMFILSLLSCHILLGVCNVYKDEKKLHKEIFDDYNSNVIPREFKGGPVIVNFDFSLQSLVSFDVKSQVLTAVAITMLKWKDDQLSWLEYPDIETISVDAKTIWTPDIVLYNTAQVSSASHMDIYKTRPIISRDGWVIWNAPVTWQVSCSSDITWFPVDKQVCEMFFGSWSYDEVHMEVLPFENITAVDSFYSKVFQVENGEWLIASIKSEERYVAFECCKNPFSSIVYKIELERMSLFYFIYIIVPLMALAFLFLFVFHIPFDSGERTGFGVTVLLSITVYLLVISEKLPEKSDRSPMLGICFIFIFFLLCLALLVSIFLMHTPHFKTKPPKFLVKFSNLGNSLMSRLTLKPSTKTKSPRNDNGNRDEIDNELIEMKKDDKIEHDEEINQQEWKIISRKTEKRLFFIFAGVLIIAPLFIIPFFPSKARAI